MRRSIWLPTALIASLCILGASAYCQAGEKSKARTQTRPQAKSTAAGGKAVSEADLKKLEKVYLASKLAYSKAGKKVSPKVKKEYVDSTYAFGYGSMTSPALPPRVKYKQALSLFREVLRVEPKHANSLKSINLIEGIYKSMGRPIPQ